MLEYLKDCKSIDGFNVWQEKIKDESGDIDWGAKDEARKESAIFIDQKVNIISFRIQNGPIKEVGVNGCQVTALIEAARMMIEAANEKYHSVFNELTCNNLRWALEAQEARTSSREQRGVEGTSQV